MAILRDILAVLATVGVVLILALWLIWRHEPDYFRLDDSRRR